MNLLCTLLYTKMQIMLGFFWGENIVAWPFVFISSPLKDPSKIRISPPENEHSVRVWRTDSNGSDSVWRRDSPVTDCRVKKEPRTLQPEGLQREFQRSVSSLALYNLQGLRTSWERVKGDAGLETGSYVRSVSWVVGLSEGFQPGVLLPTTPKDWIILLRNSTDPDKSSKHQHLQNWKRCLGKADLTNSNCTWIPTGW